MKTYIHYLYVETVSAETERRQVMKTILMVWTFSASVAGLLFSVVLSITAHGNMAAGLALLLASGALGATAWLLYHDTAGGRVHRYMISA
jgi:hypothetical protein